MSLLYAYALAEAPAPAATGLFDEPVRSLGGDDLFAAVGRVDRQPEVAPATLRRHDEVVRSLATGAALLPCRFGTLFRDEASLLDALRQAREKLTAAFAEVRGREQMTVRVFGESAPAAPAESGTAYLRARSRAASRVAEAGDALRSALGGLVFAERIEAGAAPPLLASVHHLVPAGASRDYLERLARPDGVPSGLRFTATGPWPAYAFAPGLGA